MRFIIEATVPVESGNSAIMDGSLMNKVQDYLGELKPEAAYFTQKNGQRTMFAVVNMDHAHQLPATLEPLWLDFKGNVEIYPAMVFEDFQEAGPDLERIIKKRK